MAGGIHEEEGAFSAPSTLQKANMKKRILFVDDEPSFLSGIRLMLRSQNAEWDLDFAQSVDEALQKTHEYNYDVIVSDVMMPVKDGFELLSALRLSDSTRNIPVIMLTGNAQGDLKRRALEEGAADLLNKPTSREDLIARLRSVIRLKSYQDRLEAQNLILEEKVRERTQDLERAHKDILWRLAKAGEYRDEETGDHVIRVACYCRVLAQALGLSPPVVESIFYASPLHDIGKIGVPDAVLLKAGKLEPYEWELMQKHCEMGASLLLEHPKAAEVLTEHHSPQGQTTYVESTDPLREMAAVIALAHHEKWNGEGYPRSLAEGDIPLPARIVALADVYDALRSERPYKEAIDRRRATDSICAGAGTHFDPEVVAAFEKVEGAFCEIHRRYPR